MDVRGRLQMICYILPVSGQDTAGDTTYDPLTGPFSCYAFGNVNRVRTPSTEDHPKTYTLLFNNFDVNVKLNDRILAVQTSSFRLVDHLVVTQVTDYFHPRTSLHVLRMVIAALGTPVDPTLYEGIDLEVHDVNVISEA